MKIFFIWNKHAPGVHYAVVLADTLEQAHSLLAGHHLEHARQLQDSFRFDTVEFNVEPQVIDVVVVD